MNPEQRFLITIQTMGGEEYKYFYRLADMNDQNILPKVLSLAANKALMEPDPIMGMQLERVDEITEYELKKESSDE